MPKLSELWARWRKPAQPEPDGYLKRIEDLEQEIVGLEDELWDQREKVKARTIEVSSLHKRIEQLRNDWPAIWARYFTHRGDDDRQAGRKTTTRQKPKRSRT